MFPEVNPFAESAWQNHPAPAEFPEFVRALKELGGTHVSGHPNLRLEWAPHHYQVQLGRPRRYYVDTRIPTRRKLTRMYYQVKDLTDAFAPWITVEQDDLGNYPGVRYLHVVHHDREIITISRQQWVVQQYIPPERLGDTPEGWNERRYRFFTPPETNLAEYGDCDGPFPSEGVYREVAIIEGPTEYSYRPPCERDLATLRQAMSAREQYRRSLSRAKEVANRYAELEAADRQRLEQVEERLDDELKPYDRAAEGNAFVSVL